MLFMLSLASLQEIFDKYPCYIIRYKLIEHLISFICQTLQLDFPASEDYVCWSCTILIPSAFS